MHAGEQSVSFAKRSRHDSRREVDGAFRIRLPVFPLIIFARASIKEERDFPGKRGDTRWITAARGSLVNRLGKISQRGLSFIATEEIRGRFHAAARDKSVERGTSRYTRITGAP